MNKNPGAFHRLKIRASFLGIDTHTLKLVTYFLSTSREMVAGGLRRKKEFLFVTSETLFQHGPGKSFDSTQHVLVECSSGGKPRTAEL